jgi:hypothetical protein
MLFSDEHRLFSISDREEFDSLAMEVFSFQAKNNKVYSEFIRALNLDPSYIRSLSDIPFLPVSLFKNRKVVSGEFDAEASFKSSGTSGMDRSVHHIRKLALYKSSFMLSFSLFYGDPANITIYALLPSYIERSDSSLVYMADTLIKRNRMGKGGFFLDNYPELLIQINESKERGEKILLLGVSFALLEFAEKFSPDLSGVIVMETGGMKGRRKEIVREELHHILRSRMNIDSVHSEYGMTELLSQAWSGGEGVFRTPPWMRIRMRDPLDAMSPVVDGRTGGINIIDLANIYSCSFIETSDLGIMKDDSSFEVSGRFDSSDIRGCNLLI